MVLRLIFLFVKLQTLLDNEMKAICLVIWTAIASQATSFNPYDVLGVSSRAGPDEIRKTYKKLAREL